MIVKLLTEHHLEFLSLKGGCRGLFESTLVKMPRWKSHVTAHMYIPSLYVPETREGSGRAKQMIGSYNTEILSHTF